MKCREVKIFIANSFGEDLTTAIPAEIAGHIDSCTDCSTYLNFAKSAFIELDNTNQKVQASPYFYSRLIQKIERKNEPVNTRILQKSFQPVMLTLVIFVAIAVGFFIGNSNSILYDSSDSIMEITNDEYLSYFQDDLFEEQYLNILDDEQ